MLPKSNTVCLLRVYYELLLSGIPDILENVNPDLSDSEFIEITEPVDAPTPLLGSDAGDAAPSGDLGEPEGEEGEENSGSEAEGDIDEELAAELDLALGDDDDDAGQGDDEDEEDEDEDEDESEEEDEDDDDEAVQARKLLNEEISDLEAAVRKKGNEIASSANPLIKVPSSTLFIISRALNFLCEQRRFEDALKKLTIDLEMKLSQRDEMKEQQRLKKAGVVPGDDMNEEGEGDAEVEGGEVDLFGEDEEESGMDVS